jgi:GAF domain-containing protein
VFTHHEFDQAREELTRVLEDLVRLARDGTPGCASASITVRHDGGARTMSATDTRALAIDEEQYDEGAGPCLTAMRDRGVVHVPDYAAEPRWPHVTAKARDVGVRSGLSLPVQDHGQVLGALNLYGDDAGALGDSALPAADTFARLAVVVLRAPHQVPVDPDDERGDGQREIDLECRESHVRLRQDRLDVESDGLAARERRAGQRERFADVRDLAADLRHRALDRREIDADDRDRRIAAREAAVDQAWLDQREIDQEGQDTLAQVREEAMTAREASLQTREDAAEDLRRAGQLRLERVDSKEQVAAGRQGQAGGKFR